MTLNQINYFLKTAEIGNMGRTAELLHISQPSLSVAISNLEKELNVKLFHRTGHRLFLSTDGEQFLIHAKKILMDVQEAQLHMQSLSADREIHIRIGCIAPVLYDYLPKRIQEFLAIPKNKKLKIDFTTDNTSVLIPKLREGYFDFVICSESDSNDLLQTELIREPYVLLCPPEAPVPENWEDLLEKDLIGFHIRAAAHHEVHTMLLQHGIQPVYRHRAPDEESIASLVSHGFGYGIVPRVGALEHFDIQILPLPAPSDSIVRTIYMTQLISRPPIGAAKRFHDYLTKHSS